MLIIKHEHCVKVKGRWIRADCYRPEAERTIAGPCSEPVQTRSATPIRIWPAPDPAAQPIDIQDLKRTYRMYRGQRIQIKI